MSSKVEELIGEYLNCGVAYSTDKRIRREAASGGLVSALLIAMIRTGSIDGALVVRNDGLKQKGVLARTEDEVMVAASSKYGQIPLNAFLGEVIREDGRFAIVGLPCHLKGLEKLETLYPELREKIVLKIGLFCGHAVTYNGIIFLLENLGIKPKEVTKLKYRMKMRGTTGLYVKSLNGGETFIPLSKYWMLFNFFFIPDGCMSCEDPTAECSDVSVGDAWAFKEEAERWGLSLFIVRSEAGERALKLTVSEGLTKVRRVDPKVVVRSQIYLSIKKWKYLGSFDKALSLTCHMVQSILNSASKFKVCYPLLKMWVRIVSRFR